MRSAAPTTTLTSCSGPLATTPHIFSMHRVDIACGLVPVDAILHHGRSKTLFAPGIVTGAVPSASLWSLSLYTRSTRALME